jgi:hypothetical protein
MKEICAHFGMIKVLLRIDVMITSLFAKREAD